MKRRHLRALLEEYSPSEREDESCKERFLSFVEQEERCFDRSHQVGHVTASAWLLNQEMTQALLTHHRKLGQWMQLGGHFEPEDPDVLAAAIREAREESGLASIEAVQTTLFDIDIHLIPASKKEPAHFHYDARFLLRAVNPEERISLSEESNLLRWVGNETDVLVSDPSVIRLFQKWKRFSQNRGIHV